jgi:heptosyltransferase-2
VRTVLEIDVASDASIQLAIARLSATVWARVISLDDEASVARIATGIPSRRLSGAYVRPDGSLAYTPDTAPWFDMGLLSVHGKAEADRRKVENRKSHPEIHAEMLGLRMARPALHLTHEPTEFARGFAARHGLDARRPIVGLNTGASGRWASKQLDVGRTVEVAKRVHEARGGRVTFLVLGGPAETQRNEAILAGLLRADVSACDGGTGNTLLQFAGLVGLCDALLSSDSLALHLAVAQSVRVVAFFAPTSAAEIELYGRGEKIASTSRDACSYRADADTSTLTPDRLAAAVVEQLAAVEADQRGGGSPGR